LTERQMRLVERLLEAGFRPVMIPHYENTLIVGKGEYVALLKPVLNGGLQLAVPVTLLIDGNVSVKIKKGGGEAFVWKGKEVEATVEKLREMELFGKELGEILELSAEQ